jgi:putative NIF3 family GTP cyclohydrolase 1 type 2
MKKISMTNASTSQSPERRKFILTTVKAACAVPLLNLPAVAWASANSENDLTIKDVIDLILKDIPGAPFKETVDTIKSGNADNKVTGIVTTMFATVNVIQQAIKLNANFIIAHEPTFYNHTDDVKWIEKNKVVAQKQEMLEKNNITIWRFHDYWHAYQPDGIFYGVVKKVDWLSYYKTGEHTLTIPSDSLKNIVQHLKNKLTIDHVRVIGDLSKTCKRISILPGAAGGQSQLTIVENEKPDLLIVGEVHEWETAEYIRDARLLGNDVSLIILGHSVSEEPGMEWLVQWLQPKIPAIKVTHAASQSPFIWI